ncbi:uncharacterized protein N7506_005688 [Penicillium brevicompactum]|uniref:uncharacterized protein n=1 Tax=Penicillium brevicompactum TaxID=5074 RepID=UPI002541105B|nr:uncharacterized protein N7506_005688 [Penicillium brevicompactum]KAJ5335752.1 hypothetical protein N7506_005688 [Penicillium brevicompactum]
MHRRLVLVVLGLLQYSGALIAADPAPPALNQPVPRCQQERVAVITKRSILRLARDLITITVTSTSTDTTDCTCTETSSTAFVSTDVSITSASSLPTSSPFAMATTTSTIEPITTETAMDSNPVVSVIPTVITTDSPTTVIDWRSTTVESIVTVESVITEVDTITKTVISVVPSVVTADRPTTVTDWRYTTVPSIVTVGSVITEAGTNAKTVISVVPSVVTTDRPTTVTDWRYTTVPSIVTVGSVITEAGTNTKTVISVVPSVVTADRATTPTDWRNTVLTSSVTVADVSSASSDPGIVLLGNISTILSAETLPRAENTDSRVSTPAILSGDSSPDRFTTVTVNHYSNAVQPVTRIVYETLDVTLSLEDSPTGLSTNAEASAGEAVRNKPGYTTVFTNDNQKTWSELETQSFITADTSTRSSIGELGDPPATMATDPSQEAVSGAPKTQISATTASTETPVTPSGEPSLLGNSPGKVTETAGIGESALPTTSLSAPSLSICPSRIINPTFTPLAPLPKNYTWGCPPSLLCNPSKQSADGECNFEAGPPADTYYCRPEECIRSPTLTLPVLSGPPASYERIEHYNVTRGYFNLNPTEFGLGYDIFDMNDAAGGGGETGRSKYQENAMSRATMQCSKPSRAAKPMIFATRTRPF